MLSGGQVTIGEPLPGRWFNGAVPRALGDTAHGTLKHSVVQSGRGGVEVATGPPPSSTAQRGSNNDCDATGQSYAGVGRAA